MCLCVFLCEWEERGETSVLSLGRIIYGSFAAFLPSMTSRLQDVASAADPVLSGCLSRQGPASPSGPAPRLTDDNTATLCLRELWEKKIGRPDPLFFLFFFPFFSLPSLRSCEEFCRAWSRETVREREGDKGGEEVKKDRLGGFSLMSPCVFRCAFLWPFERRQLLSGDLLYVRWKKKKNPPTPLCNNGSWAGVMRLLRKRRL